MKKYLLVASLATLAALGTAKAQSFSAPVNDNRQERVQRPPAPVSQTKTVGAFPRAARGNPLQMLNPRAPQKYRAAPPDTVTFDEANPSHITGIILFGFRW